MSEVAEKTKVFTSQIKKDKKKVLLFKQTISLDRKYKLTTYYLFGLIPIYKKLFVATSIQPE